MQDLRDYYKAIEFFYFDGRLAKRTKAELTRDSCGKRYDFHKKGRVTKGVFYDFAGSLQRYSAPILSVC